MTCEPVLDGKAIRIRSISGRMVRETHYYWNPEKGQIEYLVLTNNGYVGLGSVALGADLIVETGDQITPAGTTNRTKGTWEVDPEGRLIARGYTLKEGGWQAGHVIVFEKKPGQGR